MADTIIEHVKASICNAYANVSKCTPEIIAMEGMSGSRTRHLYNNICSIPDTIYLEVGTWKGSSFISAMFRNESAYGFCVDNWCEFGGPREECISSFSHYLNIENMTVLDMDCWNVNAEHLKHKPITVYLYDGAHTYHDQKRAITHFAPFLSDIAIIMVDDWTCDWVDVKRGTMDGIAEAGLHVLYSNEIPKTTENYHQGGDSFWNGCGVFVVSKTKL